MEHVQLHRSDGYQCRGGMGKHERTAISRLADNRYRQFSRLQHHGERHHSQRFRDFQHKCEMKNFLKIAVFLVLAPAAHGQYGLYRSGGAIAHHGVPTAAKPVDSPGHGTYAGAQTVSISTGTSGASICYTVDGSTPAASIPGTCSHGTTYTVSFTSPSSTFTLKAIATKIAYINSGLDTSVYTINPTAATPVDSPGSGTYAGAQTITITTATSGAKICYTTDGSSPTASTPGTCSHGTTYAGGFTSPSSTFTLKALATKSAYFNSSVDSSTYTINPTAATPVDFPGAGTYLGAQTVSITTATSGATICYTVDGSTPAASIPGTCSAGTPIQAPSLPPVRLSRSRRSPPRQAFSIPPSTPRFTRLTPHAATPVDSPGTGTYAVAQIISITTATSGATICYTVDGSTPAASPAGTCSAGTTYSGAFTSPGATFTLKALATKSGYLNSALDTSTYTINTRNFPAANCSQSAVQAAITAEQVSPLDGDTITIPACSATWTGTTGISQTFANICHHPGRRRHLGDNGRGEYFRLGRNRDHRSHFQYAGSCPHHGGGEIAARYRDRATPGFRQHARREQRDAANSRQFHLSSRGSRSLPDLQRRRGLPD